MSKDRALRRWRQFPAALLLVAVVVAASGSGAGLAAEPDKSDNVKVVASIAIPGATKVWNSATDLDFSGRYAFMGRWDTERKLGGVHIYDIGGRVPKEISFLPCPGGQNDVAIVRPGLLALGYHNSRCGAKGGGVTLIDVENPRRPRILGSVAQKPYGTHTLTAYPGKDLVYASPGGWGYEEEAGEGGDEYIIDVSDPSRPKVAATFDPKVAGCHDLTFHITRKVKLAACAGDTMTQLWDVSKPLAPVVVAKVYNPLSGFNHSAEISPDGKVLVVAEETFVDECNASPAGSVWVYDIAVPASPRLLSYYSISRGSPTGGSIFDYGCSAHNFKFIPGTRLLVSSWFRSGMNVLDLTDPARPKEVAHYVPPGGTYWSAYWYDGRIYASGVPGLDVFEVEGLR